MKKDQNYLRYFRKYTWLIVLATLLTSVATVLQLANQHFLSTLVSELSAGRADSILTIAVIMLVLTAIKICASFFADMLLLKVNSKVVKKIHWNLAGTLANATSESVDKLGTAILAERLREGQNFVGACTGIYEQIFNILAGVLALAYTFVTCWQIAILCLVFLIIVFFVEKRAINRILKTKIETKETSDNSKQLIIEVLDSFLAVKSQNLVFGLREHFSQRLGKEYTAKIKQVKLEISNNAEISLLLMIYQLIFLLLGGYLVKYGILSFQGFTALLLYKGSIDGLVNAILRIGGNKSDYDTSVKRMDDIFVFNKITKEEFGNSTYFPGNGTLSIQSLSAEINGKTTLHDISLVIPGGKFVGVVGSSGCGKSTLLKVIAHQLTPSSGKIFIDGHDTYSLDFSSFYKCIKLAPQQPYLFSMSVRDNLKLSNPNASDGAMWAALAECACADLVQARGGLDAVISQKELSGGEKQRLALARLGVLGAQIILLDESTSALDAESQNTILQTVKRATQTGHTVIMVAHRISTLRDADIILHMEGGTVIESGTYSELYENSESFRNLVDS